MMQDNTFFDGLNPLHTSVNTTGFDDRGKFSIIFYFIF